MDREDEPPRVTLVSLAASLDRSRADLAASRIVPGAVVLAELDACIERMEKRQAAKEIDAV